MRIIKFRCWNHLGKVMFFVTKNTICIHQIQSYRLFGFENHGFEAGKRQYSLMQWTGLKDLDGTDIYEGDIVQTKTIIGKVEFGTFPLDKDFVGWGITNKHGGEPLGPEFCEVIGNIHNNPELLKGIDK